MILTAKRYETAARREADDDKAARVLAGRFRQTIRTSNAAIIDFLNRRPTRIRSNGAHRYIVAQGNVIIALSKTSPTADPLV